MCDVVNNSKAAIQTKTYVVFHGGSKGGGRDKKGDKNGRGKLHHGG